MYIVYGVFFIWLYPFLSFILFIRLGQNLLQCCTIRYQTCVSKQYNQYTAENKSGKNILRFKNATQMFISFARFVHNAITIQVFQEACTENRYKTIRYNQCKLQTKNPIGVVEDFPLSVTIPLSQKQIDVVEVSSRILKCTLPNDISYPRIFHIDIAYGVEQHFCIFKIN